MITTLHETFFHPESITKLNSKKEKTIIRLSAGNGFRVANVFTEESAALNWCEGK